MSRNNGSKINVLETENVTLELTRTQAELLMQLVNHPPSIQGDLQSLTNTVEQLTAIRFKLDAAIAQAG